MKTLNLIKNCFKLLEQDNLNPNALNEPVDATATPAQEPQESADLPSQGEIYLINLVAKAFAYTPKRNELWTVDAINKQYRNENPKRVAKVIARYLPGVKSSAISQGPVGQKTVPLTPERERLLVDLLVKAFTHAPTEAELNIVNSLIQEFGNISPTEISDSILKLMDGGTEDFTATLNKYE
jgi:hypothetical protein